MANQEITPTVSKDYIWEYQEPDRNLAMEHAQNLILAWQTKYPDAPKFLQDYQRVIVQKCLANILQGKHATQIAAPTGSGKTFMYCSLISILEDNEYLAWWKLKHNKQICLMPYVIFNPAQVVMQTKSVVKKYPHGDKITVMNYEQLRSKNAVGSMFIQWETKATDGGKDIRTAPVWSPHIAPILIILDENQKLKNSGSLQTQCIAAFNSLRHTQQILQFFFSATPITRPSESKVVTVATECPYLVDSYDTDEPKPATSTRISAANWKTWIDDIICGPQIVAEDYSPTAMKRLTKCMLSDNSLIVCDDVKFPHKAINKHVIMDIETEEEQKIYARAYENMLERLAKIGKGNHGAMAEIFATMLAFQMASEALKPKYLMRLAIPQLKAGKSVIFATQFKETQDIIRGQLLLDGVCSYDDIATICGGQSQKERWENVNRFQDDKAKILLLMIKAGGTGLSLHHHKPRNKRPRYIAMSPVWSIIDLLQVLGRTQRINTESTTYQDVCWFKNTIEEKVVGKLIKKAMSAKELLNKKETWSSLFMEEAMTNSADDIIKQYEDQANNSLTPLGEDDEQDNFLNIDEKAAANNVEMA